LVDNAVYTQHQRPNKSVPVGIVVYEHINHSTGAYIMATLRKKMKQEMTLRGLSSGTQEKLLKTCYQTS